ncbi:MAG: AI-2E family transporter [Clostridia bacterium]|nr:AI-2E family transporter [Clostridia bacterium]
MQLSRDTKRFLLFLAAFFAALLLCMNHVASIAGGVSYALTLLSPFVVGACMAFIISVPMRLFDRILSRKGKSGKPFVGDQRRKPLSMVLAIMLILLLLVLFGSIVVPQLVDTAASLAGSVMRFVPTAQRWITELMTWLEGYPQVHEVIAPMVPDLNQLASSLINFVQKYAGIVASSLVSNVSSLFGSATDVIISFVFAIYILLQTKTLSRQSKKLLYAFLPTPFCDEIVMVARLAHKTFFSYVTIQCTEAVILGALCFAGMMIFRFPHALVISVIMLFCALIPIYGAIISCVIGAFLVLIESPMQALGFVAFILILQQLETNLIYPRVVSTSINLPPMWVMLAVTVGGGLFGVVGMLSAVPVCSIAYTLLADAAKVRLTQKNLSVYDPAPPEKEKP